MTDVHRKFKVTNYGHETVLFLVKAKDVFFEVEAKLQLVSSLLNEEHIFIFKRK